MKINNKVLCLVLTLFVSFLFIGRVYAGSLSISASPYDSVVVTGRETTIMISLRSDEAISDCMFKFENDNTLEYVGISSANGWNIDGTGVNGTLIGNNSLDAIAPVNGQNIAQLKYKVNGNGKVVIKTVECVSVATETSYTSNDVVVELFAKEPTEDTTLSELKVTNGTMNPSNISGTDTDYIINLNSSVFGLSMTASNPDYQDDIVVKDASGNVINDLNNITFKDPSGQGLMPITVTVNGKTTYSLLVHYESVNLDNTLKSITINGQQIQLIPGVYNYEHVVSKDVTNVVVAAVINDNENFMFGSSSNAPGTLSITDMVSVLIVVEPKDASIGAKSATYAIDIIREGANDDKPNDKPNNDNNKPNGNAGGNNSGISNNGSNVNRNPGTGDVSMYLMAFILVASLIGSIVLYRKNLEGYK